MAWTRNTPLAALVVVAAFSATEMAQACSAEVQPSGLSAARLLALKVESYCTQKSLECGTEVCTRPTFENAKVSVVPWVHKDSHAPWKIITTADFRDTAEVDFDRSCNFVAAEAKWIFGPGHLFATTLTTPDEKSHECPAVRAPLIDLAPFLVLPERWTLWDWSEPLAVDLKPAILSEAPGQP
jgi:hypothetical protein